MSEPTPEPEAPVTGTIVYTAADAALSRSGFGKSKTLPLWMATLVLGACGAMLGYSITGLVGSFIVGDRGVFGTLGPWGAVAGVLVVLTGAAIRLARAHSGLLLPFTQTVMIDDEGIRLVTDKAETLMRWSFLVERVTTPDYVAVKTEQNTWVLLRPSYFATPTDYTRAKTLIETHRA